MNLSTRSRYGVRAMVELAVQCGDGPVRLRTLAKNQAIPLRYLAGIVRDLRRTGLIRSMRGAHGGYLLVRSPTEIRLSDIVQCLEGSVSPVPCVDDPEVCTRHAECVTREVWAKVNDAILGVLRSMTLQEMVERAAEKKAGRAAEQ